MKTKRVLVALVLGLQLVLALSLLWVVLDNSLPVAAAAAGEAAPRGEVAPWDIADLVLSRPNQGPVQAPAAEWHVCPALVPGCDYTSVQAAVDAAGDNDVIKVATGLYTGVSARAGITQVVYINRSVTIEGGYTTLDWDTSLPEVFPTILDAQGQGRVIYIDAEIYPSIDGLHITGGDATGLDGGLQLGYDGAGGGIYVSAASAFIGHCKIYDNVAGRNDWSAGGGVYLEYSSGTALKYNQIFSNTAGTGSPMGLAGEGGGVAIAGGAPWLIGNMIMNNTAASAGDGLGGGIYLEDSTPYLANNIIRDNVASPAAYGSGGGIYNGPFGDARYYNTVIVGNQAGVTADSGGAGLVVEAAAPRLLHTTLHDNTGGNGSGIKVRAYPGMDSWVAMTNTILTSQTVGITVTWNPAVTATVTLDGILWFGNGANTGGGGTITPTNQVTGSPAFFADGYHIRPSSAAVDAAPSSSLSYDIDLQSRPYNTLYDFGADELVVISDTVDPNTGAVLIFTDTSGVSITVEIPPGAVVHTTTFVLTPLISPTQPFSAGLCYAGQALNVDAFCHWNLPFDIYLPLVASGQTANSRARATQRPTSPSPAWGLRPTFSSFTSPPENDLRRCWPVFSNPVTITVRYLQDYLGCVGDESSLKLYYWTGNEWADAASTCSPPSTYTRDIHGNVLGVPICHLTQYAIGGK